MKNQTVVVISALSVLVGLVVGFMVWGAQSSYSEKNTGQHRMSDGTMMDNADMSDMNMDGGHMMPDGTWMEGTDMPMTGMDHMDMMVKSEREFLIGMIPHHEEAVTTAKEVLARGGSTEEIRTLAENIIVAQESEIAKMKEWYLAWYGEPYQSTGTYTPMMRDLSKLSGAALDRVFLEDMIMHHMGALMMAESVEAYIEHAEILALSKNIIRTQTEEIESMKRLVSGL